MCLVKIVHKEMINKTSVTSKDDVTEVYFLNVRISLGVQSRILQRFSIVAVVIFFSCFKL